MRTPGGHRRIALKSVRAWQTRCGHEVTENIVGRRERIPLLHCEDFIRLLLNDQRTDIDEAMRRVRRRMSVAELCDNTLAPSLVKLGWMHQCREIDDYQLNIACQRVRCLLFRLSDTLPLPLHALRAVGATAVGDPADLASMFAEVTLREIGWDAESLGADLTGVSLGDAARARGAVLIWVCYTHTQPTEVLTEHNQHVNQRLADNARLVIGGGALTPQLRRSLKFHFFGDSLTQLSSYAHEQFGRVSAA